MSERHWMELIARSTPDECREIGRLMLSLADDPRDIGWKSRFAAALSQMPLKAEAGLAESIRQGRARLQQRDDELLATGWHPDQMRQKLEELGYRGIEPASGER